MLHLGNVLELMLPLWQAKKAIRVHFTGRLGLAEVVWPCASSGSSKAAPATSLRVLSWHPWGRALSRGVKGWAPLAGPWVG
jgi:hypothetical protein